MKTQDNYLFPISTYVRFHDKEIGKIEKYHDLKRELDRIRGFEKI